MNTVLVTGGAGFIGSHYIHHLLETERETRVINLDKLTYAGNPQNVQDIADDPRYTFVQGDVCDRALVAELFGAHHVDTVVHFAAESHVDRSIRSPGVFARTNVLGTLSLLQCAQAAWEDAGGWRAGTRFVYVSTDEVYGAIREGSFTEQSPLAPRSPYSASKASADMFVQAFRDTYGLPVNIVRCGNNFGTRQHSEKLIPHVITCAMQRQSVPVYGDGTQIRDWIAVPDAVRAIHAVARQGRIGEVYNIGAGNELRNLDLVRRILARLRETEGPDISDALITHVEDRKGHDCRYSLDSSKLRRELGWQPALDFEEYLRYTIDWYAERFRAGTQDG